MSLPNSFQDKTGAVSLSLLDDNFSALDNRTKNLVGLANWTIEEANGLLTFKYNGTDVVAFSTSKIAGPSIKAYENASTITENYTVTAGSNSMSAGPITIADGVTVTVPDGSTWTVV
jgi:hypothetical protein